MKKRCISCMLPKSRWASAHGFVIGKKTYCCIQCGYGGCICIADPARKKKARAALPKS